jgi:hypothetical protein
MIDRDAALKAVAENDLVTAIRMIRALPAAPAEDVRAGALKEAAAIASDMGCQAVAASILRALEGEP